MPFDQVSFLSTREENSGLVREHLNSQATVVATALKGEKKTGNAAEEARTSQRSLPEESTSVQDALKVQPPAGQMELSGHQLFRPGDKATSRSFVPVVVPSQIGLRVAETMEAEGVSQGAKLFIKFLKSDNEKSEADDKLLQEIYRKCATGQGEEGTCSDSGFPLFEPAEISHASRRETSGAN